MTEAAAPKARPGTYHIFKSIVSDDPASGPLSGFLWIATVEGSKKDAEDAASKAAGTEICTVRILKDCGVGTLALKPDLSWS